MSTKSLPPEMRSARQLLIVLVRELNTDLDAFAEAAPKGEPIAIPIDEEFLKRLPQGKCLDVLDLGCGSASNSLEFARKGHRVTALDLCPTQFDRAKGLAETENLQIEFLRGDATELHVPSRSFDLILFKSVLTNVFPRHRRVKMMQEAGRVLRPTGEIWLEDFHVTLSNRRYIKRYLANLSARKEMFSFDVHDKNGAYLFRSKHFFTSQLSKLAEEAELKIQKKWISKEKTRFDDECEVVNLVLSH